MNKRYRSKKSKLLPVLVVSLLFAGCFGSLTPSLVVSIKPDPIIFEFGELSKDITVTFTTKGIGKLELKNLEAVLTDHLGETVWEHEVAMDEDFFVVPGIDHSETITLDLPSSLQHATEEIYDAELKGKTYSITLVVTGSMDPITATSAVKFE